MTYPCGLVAVGWVGAVLTPGCDGAVFAPGWVVVELLLPDSGAAGMPLASQATTWPVTIWPTWGTTDPSAMTTEQTAPAAPVRPGLVR